MTAASQPLLKKTSISLNGFDDLRTAALVLILALTVVCIFFVFGIFAVGMLILLIGFVRAQSTFFTILISSFKRPIPGMTPAEPALIRFNAGEGYPAEICYLTAFRVDEKRKPAQYCLAFPVRTDNAFEKVDDATRCLGSFCADGIFPHPLSRKNMFVHDRTSASQRVELFVRLLGWSVVVGIGLFLMISA